MIDLRAEFSKNLKDGLQRFKHRYQVFIKKGMSSGVGSFEQTQRTEPNATGKLDVRTGKLLRSFMPNQDGNIDKYSQSGDNYVWEFGSELPYASIHNSGGFIKSKGKMHKYFWAMYYKTGNVYMKNLALSVKKKGGVRIPKRPYFDEAEKLVAKDIPNVLMNVVKEFARTYEAQNVSI